MHGQIVERTRWHVDTEDQVEVIVVYAQDLPIVPLARQKQTPSYKHHIHFH